MQEKAVDDGTAITDRIVSMACESGLDYGLA